MKKVAINVCYGGFGLSDAAYQKLIDWGIPVQKYVEETRDPVTGKVNPKPLNGGMVIFDRELTPPGESKWTDLYHETKHDPAYGGMFSDRYWEVWLHDTEYRAHPLIIRVIEELGEAANGEHAALKIVEIPDDVEFTIEEYDGLEHVAENHRTWS